MEINWKEASAEYVNKIINDILKLPDLIFEKSSEILSLKDKQAQLEEDINKTKYFLLESINTEVDEKGKLRFSNDTKRELELRRRISSNPNFKKTEREYEDLKADLSNKYLELELIKNQFSAKKAVVKFLSNPD